MNDNSKRTEEFKANAKLDKLISELSQLLGPVQQLINQNFRQPKHRVTLVVGAPRSGTTLTAQVLAQTNRFCFPTNVLNRFAYAPRIGCLVQQMLFNPEFDHRGEFENINSQSIELESMLGKTQGALSISEFFHFWRRFIPSYEPGYLSKQQREQVKIEKLQAEVASIQDVFDRPFLCKGKMLQYNMAWFVEQMPELLFVYVKRDPIQTMQSIVMAREKYFGRRDTWWAVKPKEYQWLKYLSPLEQVAGQVFFTELNIEKQLQQLPTRNYVVLEYEKLCEQPVSVINQILSSADLPKVEDVSKRLSVRRPQYLSDQEVTLLARFYREFKQGRSAE